MKLLALASIVLAFIYCGCDRKPSTSAPTASESRLAGAWDGRAGDWGDVRIKAAKEGYAGTYSSTYNRELGNFEFRRTQADGYAGEWWESDKKRRGSFELTASPDGQFLSVAWEAAPDDGAAKPEAGLSTWTRKTPHWFWGYGIGLAVALLIGLGIYRFCPKKLGRPARTCLRLKVRVSPDGTAERIGVECLTQRFTRALEPE